MRIALIADIHGNVVALDEVLAELEKKAVDQIVCLGDVAAGGPRPAQTLERLRELDCPVVMGNADQWLLTPQNAVPSTRRCAGSATSDRGVATVCLMNSYHISSHSFQRSSNESTMMRRSSVITDRLAQTPSISQP